MNPAEWMPLIAPLLEANWAETGADFPFAPDLQVYQQMYAAGIMFAVAAIVNGEVVGYCTAIVSPHQHNGSVICGANDALFVSPEYRNGTTTARIMKTAEAEAKARGATRFSWHCRAGTMFADMLERHGYTPTDVVMMKGLQDGL